MIFKLFMKIFFFYVLACFVILIGGAAIGQAYFKEVAQTQNLVAKIILDIPYGSSLKKVSKLLFENKIINNHKRYYWYSRLGRQDSHKIQAGYYEFDGKFSYAQIAHRLLHGTNKAVKIIFKEGETLVDLANNLQKLGLIFKKDFVSSMTKPDILNIINAPNSSARKKLTNDMGGIEGYLFPDTYFLNQNISAEEIILKLHNRLLELLTPKIYSRIEELNMTLHQVLTLGSIIEKETGADFERPVIASVYLNRLKKKMRLQADPTVIYGIKNYAGKISKKDLLTYHPYNTYKISGLPPGPISSVGLNSIKAVLWPEETNYLYFVSKNDGTHKFCENLSCHNKAVKKWQIDYFKLAK